MNKSMPLLERLAGPLKLGLGGAPLGNLYEQLSDAEAERTLEEAWRLGLRYFDTAPLYGHGLSELRLGRMLRTQPREDFVLSTKVGRLLRPDPAAPPERDGYVHGAAAGAAFRLQLRRHPALDRREPGTAGPLAHRHRADPRHRPPHAWPRRAARALSRGDGRRLPRARSAARRRRAGRHRHRRERVGGVPRRAGRAATSTA